MITLNRYNFVFGIRLHRSGGTSSLPIVPSGTVISLLRHCLSGLLLALAASLAVCDEVETTGGQILVQPTNVWGAYYAPNLLLSSDTVFMYVQGGESTDPRDSIWLYTHPNTWAGLTTAFTGPRTRITVDDGFYYGEHSAFRDASHYLMTACKSPDAVIFNKQMFGTSTDGSTWSWSTLFTTPSSFDVPNVTLQPTYLNGQAYWWGTMQIFELDANHQQTGSYLAGLRVPLTTHTSSSYTFTQIQIQNAAGTWVNVAVGSQLPF